MTEPEVGYAVINRVGKILVRTVSPTPTAAMVNWLYLCTPEKPTNGWSDELIEQVFNNYAKITGAKRVEVVISVAQQPNG